MFLLLAFSSAFFFALQQVLLSRYTKKMSALDIAFYRNGSLVITMLPLLFFVPKEEYHLLVNHLDIIFISGLVGIVSLILLYEGVKYIPVGIATAFRTSIIMITTFTLGFLSFHEPVHAVQMAAIAFLIGGILFLGSTKSHIDHIDSNMIKGSFFSLVSGVLSGIWYYTTGVMARSVSPYLGAYIGEASIAIGALVFVLLRSIFLKTHFVLLPKAEVLQIALYSSSTILGTTFVSLAFTMGSLGITNAIGTSGIIFTGILGVFIAKEKLTSWQWLGMIWIAFAIVALKLL